MSFEDAPQAFVCNGITYPLLLDGEIGTKHLVNPWKAFAGGGLHSCCDDRELTHVDVISRELLPVCQRCIEEARKVQTNAT
jgi:hypothetical protein